MVKTDSNSKEYNLLKQNKEAIDKARKIWNSMIVAESETMAAVDEDLKENGASKSVKESSKDKKKQNSEYDEETASIRMQIAEHKSEIKAHGVKGEIKAPFSDLAGKRTAEEYGISQAKNTELQSIDRILGKYCLAKKK